MLDGVEKVSFLITPYALVERAYFATTAPLGSLVALIRGDEIESLRNDVIMLYGAILRFLARALHYYNSNTASE